MGDLRGARSNQFLENARTKPAAKTRNLASLVDEKGMFTLEPADLVFFEKSSTLMDAKVGRITSWWVRSTKAGPKSAKASMAAA